TRLNNDIATDKQQLTQIEYSVKRLNEELFEEQNKLEDIKQDLENNKQEVEELRGQQQSAKGKLDSFTKDNAELQNNIYRLEKDIAVLGIQKDALEQESLRTANDAIAKEVELNQFSLVVAELEERVNIQQEQFDAALHTEEQRSEEHTSELQSRENLVCRLLLEKKKKTGYEL